MKITLGTGRCMCIHEPRGEHGLEGYQRGDEYTFHWMRDAQGEYFRVFPVDDEHYYETCSTRVFNRFFKKK